MKKTIRIKLSPEAEEVYNYLNKEVAEVEKSGKKRTAEVQIFEAFQKKKELIKVNMHYGEPISKSKIPEKFKIKYGITNLFWVELPHFWRFLYSLTEGDSEIEIIAFVLDITDHKKYDKLFGYKKK
ncbi:MAG: hypothetical protein KKH88_03070 [Nanoarchaeota archaeon]|nr:hypothetical protein [Nanoarchaeota archaeon]